MKENNQNKLLNLFVSLSLLFLLIEIVEKRKKTPNWWRCAIRWWTRTLIVLFYVPKCITTRWQVLLFLFSLSFAKTKNQFKKEKSKRITKEFVFVFEKIETSHDERESLLLDFDQWDFVHTRHCFAQSIWPLLCESHAWNASWQKLSKVSTLERFVGETKKFKKKEKEIEFKIWNLKCETDSKWFVHPNWHYCWDNLEHEQIRRRQWKEKLLMNMKPEEVIEYFMEINQKAPQRFAWIRFGKESDEVNNTQVEFLCNKELLESFMFDARATKIEPKASLKKLS